MASVCTKLCVLLVSFPPTIVLTLVRFSCSVLSFFFFTKSFSSNFELIVLCVMVCCRAADSILRKAHKFGYTTEVLKVTDMLQNADNKLFLTSCVRSSHCLHTLLPDLKVIDIVLRNS